MKLKLINYEAKLRFFFLLSVQLSEKKKPFIDIEHKNEMHKY